MDNKRVGSWVCERTGGYYIDGVGIGLEENGELIAGVLYDMFNGKSIAMHVAAVGSRWMTKEYLRYCFEYPFKQLGVKKILGLVDTENIDAQVFDEHLGFVVEATIKDAARRGDLIVYSMTKDQCRFLGEKYGKRRLAPASA